MRVMVTDIKVYEVEISDELWQNHADVDSDMGDQLDMTIEAELAAGNTRSIHRHFAVTASSA